MQICLACEVNFHSKTKFLASNLRQFQAGRTNFTAKSKLILHKLPSQPKQNQHKFHINCHYKAKSNFT